MNILHLTDLHFNKEATVSLKQHQIISTLKEHLKSKGKIDLILFTGDLVETGECAVDFENAQQLFIDPLVTITGIKKENFILCPGNHDVYRNQEMEAIKTHIAEKITTNDLLDKFVSNSSDKQFIESCKNHNHYNEFIKQYFSSVDDIIEPLYSIHIREFNGVKVGIVSINTAWRSFSKYDKGKLLFPKSLISKAIQNISECDRKIIIMHHDLSYLMDFNAYDLEDIIYQNFHYMFFGHDHKKKQSLQLTSYEGIFCCSTPATFTLTTGNTKIGYTLVQIDLATHDVRLQNSIYDWQSNIFLDESCKDVIIPLGEVKKEQNEFRKTLREHYISELGRASELFVSGQDEVNSKNFLDLFSNPVIKTIQEIETYENKDKNKYNFDYYDFLKCKDSFVVYGKNKSGKSSLLKKIQLDLLSNFSTHLTIPFYIDVKEYWVKGEKLNLLSKIARYYKSSQAKLLKKLEYAHLTLLVDNYQRDMDTINSELEKFITETPNSSFIAVSELYIFKSYEKSFLDGIKYKKLFIHDITRTEIKSLIEKWPNIPNKNKALLKERIVEIFNQLNIPYNYWTVSLFLWIFEKTHELNLNNNVELIQLYIDNLLERQKIVITGVAKLPYENFKSFLADLAYHMVLNYYENSYSMSYKELIDFTEDYRKHNLRFVVPTEEIIERIIERGIIAKRENDLYSFRLRGVFEFFIAHYMKDNPEFREKIISDDKFYLSFGNELELYSGFSKKDTEFLRKIYDKTKFFLEPAVSGYEKVGNLDLLLVEKVASVFDVSGAINQLKKSNSVPLQPERKDEIMDQLKPLKRTDSEVSKKRMYDEIIMDPELYEKFIFILSRVFRNTDLIQNDELIKEVFDFLTKYYCYFGFYLIDEAAAMEETSPENSETLLLELMTNFIPIIIQSQFTNAVGQTNLERIIRAKIAELPKKEKRKSEELHNNDEYLLFILYSLLIDLNVEKNIKEMDDLIKSISINVLKSSVLIKLYSYLMFDAYNNPNMEKYIREKIQDITIKLDVKNKSSLGDLHKKLEERHKRILLQRQQNKF